VVGVLQTRYAPTWLVGSRGGLQTILQALPATLIALFVLAFTTLFVAVQQVVNVFSSRAPLILNEDVRVRRIVARTAVIAVVALLMGGQVTDVRRPSHHVTAAVATLLLAAVLLVYSYGRFATMLISEYSAPRAFISRVTSPVLRYLDNDRPRVGMVVFRIPLLGQALRYALRRDDSEGVGTALEGLLNLQAAYVKAAQSHPEVRYWAYEGGPPVEGWIGGELCRVLVAASEEALRLQIPQSDVDLIVNCHATATIAAIEARQVEESEALLIGLAQEATTPYQVSALGAPLLTRFLSKTAPGLAACERAAEQQNLEDVAVLALACWAVATVYPHFQIGVTHPLFEESLEKFGSRPPWDLAIAKVKEQRWRHQWANQLGNDALDFLPRVLDIARSQLPGATNQGGQSLVEHKKAAYNRWLEVVQGLASSTGRDWSFEKFRTDIDTAMAALGLVASREVRSAVQSYIDHLGEGMSAVLQATAGISDADEQRTIATARLDSAMREHRDRVIDAMRRDIGSDVEA